METTSKIIRVSAVLSLIIIAFFVFTLLNKQNKIQKTKLNENEISRKKKIIEKKDENGKDKPEPVKKKDNFQPDQINIKLSESDFSVRLSLIKCSSHQDIKKISKTESIVRRFVSSIDNISNGESPAKNLDFIVFNEKLKTSIKSNYKIINPESYNRYNYISNIFLSFDEVKLVELYKLYRPLLIEAFKELGYPELNFHDTFLNAINVLLKTPVIYGDIFIEQKVISYVYADEKLEKLNNAQKQFLRMGPSNIKKIKIKLQLLKELLINI